MGQVIEFPAKQTQASAGAGEACAKAGNANKNDAKKNSAQLLFFTGVRYERMPEGLTYSLPSQRLYPPIPHN